MVNTGKDTAYLYNIGRGWSDGVGSGKVNRWNENYSL